MHALFKHDPFYLVCGVYIVISVTSQDNNRLKMNIQIVCMVFFSVYANVHCEDIVLSLTYTWPQEPAGYDRIAKVAVPETQPGEKVPVVFDLHGMEI